MISLEDCIALSGLTEEEIFAIAEHERVPAAVACGLSHYLVERPGGSKVLRKMIIEDIRAAQVRGDSSHVKELLHVLHHFLTTHPEAAPKVHPWSRGQ